MLKSIFLKSVCVVMTILMVTGSGLILAGSSSKSGSSKSGDSCDGLIEPSKKMTLQDYVDGMNRHIAGVICRDGEPLSEHALDWRLDEFYELQSESSGELICEEDGVKYYYPNFVLKREDNNYKTTEFTRYKLSPLGKDKNGIYTGISVTAFESELEAKIKEINQKIKKYTCSFCSRDQVDKAISLYKEFQKEYSGKLLYDDPDFGKIYLPNYTLRFHGDLDVTLYDGKYEYVGGDGKAYYKLGWSTKIEDVNDRGLYTGIVIGSELIKLDETIHTNTTSLILDDYEIDRNGDLKIDPMGFHPPSIIDIPIPIAIR